MKFILPILALALLALPSFGQVPAANTIRIPQSNGTKFINRDILPSSPGVLGWTGTTLVERLTSAGGNGAADDGKVLLFGTNGIVTASGSLNVTGTGGDTVVLAPEYLALGDGATGFTLNLYRPEPLAGNLTVNLPFNSGTLISTGDTGTVTNTMLAGSIAPSKVTGTAAILGANTFTGQQIVSLNGAASTPPVTLTGTWFSGGSATTTKPQLLIEPTGTTSTNWSTSGTGLGINAASGFSGNFIDVQENGSRWLRVTDDNNNYGVLDLFSAGGSFVSIKSIFGMLRISNSSSNGRMDIAGDAGVDHLRIVSNNGATVYTVIAGKSAGVTQLGATAATPVAQTFKGPDTSTNGNAGAALSIQGGNGLTTGAGGALNLDGGDSPSGTDGNVVIGGTRGNVVIGPSGTAFNKSAVYTYALTETVEAQTVETITVTATGVADGDKVAVEIPDPGDGVCVQSIDCTTDAIVMKYWNTNTVTNRTLSGTLRFRTFEE